MWSTSMMFVLELGLWCICSGTDVDKYGVNVRQILCLFLSNQDNHVQVCEGYCSYFNLNTTHISRQRQGSEKRDPSPQNLTATKQTTEELGLKNPTIKLLSWAKGTKLDVPCGVLEQIDKINRGWLGHL